MYIAVYNVNLITLNDGLSGNKFNFNKYGRGTIDSLGTRYDYGSVMHYQKTAFSKNGKPTIVSKKPGVCFQVILFQKKPFKIYRVIV